MTIQVRVELIKTVDGTVHDARDIVLVVPGASSKSVDYEVLDCTSCILKATSEGVPNAFHFLA